MAIAYFEQNPDVAAAYAQNSYGMTPEQFAQTHYQLYGASEQRAAPTTTTTTQQATSSAKTSSPSLFGNLESVARNWEGGRNPIPLNDPIVHIANQILSQGLTSKWTGEGAGSPEANALYMADTLRKAGITDISQFGEIKQTVRGEPIYSGGSGDDPGVLLGYGPDREITTYGNKETGQALANTYGERQTGNAWGGTYAGEGNTAYRVQFDASGNPLFYTTGASSSDVGDLAPLLAIGSMLVAPGLSGLIGGATGLTGGALAAATGATLGAGTSALTGNDILKGALLGGGTGYLSSLLSSGVTDADLLQQAADADIAGGMLPEYGTNAAYDAAMADLIAASPGAISQIQNVVNDVTGVNADTAGGLIPDYGVTYDKVMADLMAQSPGATEQLENIVNSQVGGTLGPDNIDIGGVLNPTDLGMNSNLTMSQIESGLGTEGYGYGAQAAESGLFNPVTIGSGAYTQTSYPYDYADFASADTSQLYDQVGANPAAIEQNLVASGVDPLVAADIANQVTLNPTITNDVLTNYVNTSFGGNNLYDVNTAAQYPTSVLNGTGGLLTDIPTTTTSTTPEVDYSNEGRNYPTTESTQGAGGSPVNASITTTTTVPSLNDVLNVVKAGTAVAGLVGGASALNQQPTGFEIVPVPSDWKSPTYGQTGQWPALTPIDFGSRDLLRGTQWEKYINPAQPITPVPAPTGMNYGQLMSVLQGGQGGTLSLNDIISGIQSQYGQTNTGTVGK